MNKPLTIKEWQVGLAETFSACVEATYQDLIDAAVLAEREACAKLCDDLDDDIVDGLAGWQYAEAIRARGQA